MDRWAGKQSVETHFFLPCEKNVQQKTKSQVDQIVIEKADVNALEPECSKADG